MALPVVGVAGTRMLPAEVTGNPLPPYQSTASAVGEGVYLATNSNLVFSGEWENRTIPADQLGADQSAIYAVSTDPGAGYVLAFNGQSVEVVYSTGPEHGKWAVMMDGQPYLDEDSGQPLLIDAYTPTLRYNVNQTLKAETAGEHRLMVSNTGEKNDASRGTAIALANITVLPQGGPAKCFLLTRLPQAGRWHSGAVGLAA